MVTLKQLLQCAFLTGITTGSIALAFADRTVQLSDLRDPFDPFDIAPSTAAPGEPDPDEAKSATDLLREATILLSDERPLDARTKLLKAIQKDPKEFKAYYLLSGYYMVHVGHFRLALKYIKRAKELFEDKNGAAPYASATAQFEHAGILYYLSQIRLNLDNYQGALDALDEFQSYGYYDDWYPGSRAWILMKLGRVEEAVKVARLGVLGGAEPGRTLNMLGILLSMIDQRKEALDIFRQAIGYELSLGTEGQPATPLNNAGEVYKELFQEDKAEQAWLRATSLPDGCEHVLPALNLALLTIDQTRLVETKRAIDAFEACVAQYPLRNGEEHRALVEFARGRIAMHTGFIENAIRHFENALQGIQWFGKIGTSQDDLKAGVTMSLAQALLKQNNLLHFRRYATWKEWFAATQEAASNKVRSWWLLRRARQLMTEDLNDLEDLNVRNTDSMIEYPTLGDVLEGLPEQLIISRLDKESEKDSRSPAKLYYKAYKAQRLYHSWFGKQEGRDLALEILRNVRNGQDELLFVHVASLRLSDLDPNSDVYANLATKVYRKLPAALRSYGFRLPVQISANIPSEVQDELESGPFVVHKGNDVACQIETATGTKKYTLQATCPLSNRSPKTVEADSPESIVNALSDAIFTDSLKP